ncbi:IclR family transcriptional regulator [Porphyrobacter sp. HT-58-2]|uniref:IclR family transcriptional regulator n=1 Tax=Porphyrobacter sp. HT-58-2 TaxID=2023229 RepID=UPI00155911C0|nr:IclR family transcriptional regulator C-terminal domain-containing protein [Porphyrobacter sp. HT-58-2]
MASVSQSVSRCIALYALFADRKSGLTGAEIAEHLDAPRSSVAALLKELSELSMISLNRRTLTYLPTLKFAQLGAWLIDPGHFPPPLAELMEELQRESGETVTASWPIDHEMEIIRVVKSRNPISFVAEIGQRLPLWYSSVGLAYLASLSNQQIHARWEKDRRALAKVPDLDSVIDAVSHVRTSGMAVVHGGVFAEASAVAMLVGYELDGRPLVVSIAGPEARIRTIQQRLTGLITRTFGSGIGLD